jgi:hypothetical protein
MAAPSSSLGRWGAPLFVFVWLGSIASAAGGTEASRVAYSAPPTCPDGGAFVERVRARTPYADLAERGGTARFVVTIVDSDGASSGTVQFSGARREPVVRHVAGRSCDEVASAAALIVALAIEATLDAGGDPPRPDSEASRPTARDAPRSPERPTEPRVLDERDAFRWGAGAMAGWDSWSAPSGALVFGAFAQLTGPAPVHVVRLGVRGAAASTALADRRATFTALGARVSVCPVSIELAPRLDLAPCAGVDLGQLSGKGVASAALADARTAAIFWAALDTGVLARWQATDLLAIELGGELGFPLVRHNFIFEGPTQLIYEVPTWGAGVSVGAAVRFH